MAARTLLVSSPRELDEVIRQHSLHGYFLAARGEGYATLRKPKEFNPIIALLGLIPCGLGLLAYLIVYALQSDDVVELRVGQATPFLLSEDRRWWWDGQAWQDAERSVPPGAPRSEDGFYWWDGSSWRPVPPRERPSRGNGGAGPPGAPAPPAGP